MTHRFISPNFLPVSMGAPVANANRRRVFRLLAVIAAISTYATIVLGGSVSSSDAGLACPDWPLCNGAVVPDFGAPGVAIEYVHRLVAATTSLLLFVTMLAAWLWFRGEGRLVLLSTASVVALAVQVTLGMLTITTRLDPLVVTSHLALATATFASALSVAIVSFLPPPLEPQAVSAPA